MAGRARARLLLGHRGSRLRAPENTLESFRLALQEGANALETDVHVTVDGHVVVSHDADGRRMAATPRRLADCTLDEVRAWDAGRGFAAAADSAHPAGDRRIPTLDEVLAEFPGVPVNVDIKPPARDAVRRVVETVCRRGDAERVTLGSFHASNMAEVRRLRYPGPRALAPPEVVRMLFVPASLLRRWRPDATAAQVPTRVRNLRLDSADFVQRCHDFGMRVDYWVINDLATARRLLDLGADGLVTDDPALLAPLFQ